MAPKEFHCDIDLKGLLYLGGSAGIAGQVLASNGPSSLPTWQSVSASVSDGDRGDITVSDSGATWTIDNDVVTYAKIQNVSTTDRILGRSSAGAGDIEEIVCTSAGRALLDDANNAAQRATLGVASYALTIALS